MPKIRKLKKARALKAQKMIEVMRSRKEQMSREKENIPTRPNENDVVCTVTGQVETGVKMPMLPNMLQLKPMTPTSLGISNQDSRPEPIEGDWVKTLKPMTPKSFEISNQDSRPEPIENVLEVEPESTEPQSTPIIGRRILDINHFYAQLKEISNHGPFNCGLGCVDIIGEKQIGLRSKFTLQCKMCGETFYVDNDLPNDLDVNRRAVAGAISIGCGHAQLEELSAALDLPLISSNLYQDCHGQLADKWEKIALDSMNKAAEEERNLSIAEGRVDKNGIPIIDVIVDGCWSKRTYKKNYSALSGAAAIIGKRTGKILFLGVKNKYCCICLQAENKGCDPKEHVCYKNYSGPSTGMESAILLEGFKTSIDMHNLIYGRMVSDGDSSTYSKLLQSRPYPHVTIQKIECRNHILRNFCNKIEQLKTDTKYPLRFRKCITQTKIMIMRKTIRMAIRRYTSESESVKNANVELLYNDILLAHLHAFDDHSRCKPYFCSKEPSAEPTNNDLFTSTLWSRICLLLSNVASHSPSLIHDVDSNAVERYNSIVAKFVGGKRINFSRKGSYQTRCQAAVVSFNTQKVVSSVYKSIVTNISKGKINILEERRLRKSKLMKKYSRKKKRLPQKGQDIDYGEKCVKPDMLPDMYEREKNTFLSNLRKTEEERNNIQKETVLQSSSSEWMEIRRNMLTASNFGKVIKRRKDVSCTNLVKNLLYKSNLNNVQSINHGRDNEKIAIKQLADQEKVQIKACGLFIHEEIPFLGATPDGVIDKDTIVEIKCPITAIKLGFDEAVNQKKITFYKKNKNKLEINKNHDWFFQIQGQLQITKSSKCLFGIWHGENNRVITEIIERDDVFWENCMKEKLTTFYIDCILPELVDPRHSRSMPLRDPDYILKAIEDKKNQHKENKKIEEELTVTSKNIDEIIEQQNIEDEMTWIDSKNKTEEPQIKNRNIERRGSENETRIEVSQILRERQLNFLEF